MNKDGIPADSVWQHFLKVEGKRQIVTMLSVNNVEIPYILDYRPNIQFSFESLSKIENLYISELKKKEI